jgi:hypothetical protein
MVTPIYISLTVIALTGLVIKGIQRVGIARVFMRGFQKTNLLEGSVREEIPGTNALET